MSSVESHIVIAIDGPAASGKSSVSQILAKQLGFAHIDTGAMYRAMTWRLLGLPVDTTNAEAIVAALETIDTDYSIEDGHLRQRLDGLDPTAFLKDDDVSASVSNVASVPEVRALLVASQQALLDVDNLVMEGRDIGSNVFPDSPHKFYIDADPEVRAQRRRAEGSADAIRERDKIDSTRKTAPLKVADNAVVIDSTKLTLDAVVAKVADILRDRGLAIHS